MKKILVSTLTALSVAANSQPSLDIRFQPDSIVYVYENLGVGSARMLYTAVIQNIAFVNTSKKTWVVDEVTITARKEGKEILTKRILKAEILASAATYQSYQQAGVLELYDFQFQTSRYLDGVRFSSSDTLAAGQGFVVSRIAMLFDELPDELEVRAQAIDQKKGKHGSSKTIKLTNHKSKNTYRFPLKDRWVAASGPSLNSHHRWASIQEFAFDFIKIGENTMSFKNEGTQLTDYYAYGEPVMAIADGKVVSVQVDIEENSENLKRPDETEEDYLKRVMSHQQALMMKGFQFVLGNHVIIEHANAEYSFYLHLKPGDTRVKPGDMVKQGQVIGAVGNSGNSTEPHLHFHLGDSPDITYSRSLPIRFSGIKLYPDDNGSVTHLHTGQLVRSEP